MSAAATRRTHFILPPKGGIVMSSSARFMLKMEGKERLDVLMCKRGLAESREKAKNLIQSGCVYIEDICVSKPSLRVLADSSIIVKNCTDTYVGRGAYKLKKALDEFKIDLIKAVAVDVGASTGGFTECMLRAGAAKVYAVDVGHDQLHSRLRSDKRVVVMDGMNFRYADKTLFTEKIDFVTADVSFISLKHILPAIVEICQPFANAVVLVKPQFEAGKNNVGKNGIVKDRKVHFNVLDDFNATCLSNNLHISNITYSPVRGGDGNIEYLAHLESGLATDDLSEIFKGLIREAFELL